MVLRKPIWQQPLIRRTLLGQLMVEGGFISESDLQHALKEQEASGQRLGEIAVDCGMLTESELSSLLYLQESLRDGGLARIEESADGIRGLRLGELLHANGVIGDAQLRLVLDTASTHNETLGEVLMKQGMVTSARLRFWQRVQKKLQVAASVVLLGASTAGQAVADNVFQLHAAPPVPVSASEIEQKADVAISGFIREQGHEVSALAGNSPSEDVDKELELMNRQQARVRELAPLVAGYAHRFNLRPGLVMAVIHTESSFNELAESAASAIGLMQIVPFHGGVAANGILSGSRQLPSREELLNPGGNIRMGTAYLSSLGSRYLSFIEDDAVREVAAVAAYNWGPTRLRAQLRREGVPADVEAMHQFINRHAPPETRRYVARVFARSVWYEEWYERELRGSAAETLVAGLI